MCSLPHLGSRSRTEQMTPSAWSEHGGPGGGDERPSARHRRGHAERGRMPRARRPRRCRRSPARPGCGTGALAEGRRGGNRSTSARYASGLSTKYPRGRPAAPAPGHAPGSMSQVDDAGGCGGDLAARLWASPSEGEQWSESGCIIGAPVTPLLSLLPLFELKQREMGAARPAHERLLLHGQKGLKEES